MNSVMQMDEWKLEYLKGNQSLETNDLMWRSVTELIMEKGWCRTWNSEVLSRDKPDLNLRFKPLYGVLTSELHWKFSQKNVMINYD